MTDPSTKRLLLVDGHYYLYRSFFAIRGLTNSRGEPTNAIYGFVKALRRMLADLKPDYAAVIWDAGLPERRTQLQPEYKQQRDEMPGDLEIQQKPIQDLVPLLGVASLFLPNTEADDLIASYVMEACRCGVECVVATNDKDILQMVREGVSIYSTAKADLGEGNSGFKLLGVPEVREKWGVDPERIADVLALTGDAADNIPGLPGVGGKTAAKWINQYGSLDRMLAEEELDPKIREKLAPSRDLVRANRLMVALDLDLPLPMPILDMEIHPRYSELVAELRGYEFRSLTAEVEREKARWERGLVTGDSGRLVPAAAAEEMPDRGRSADNHEVKSGKVGKWEGSESEVERRESKVEGQSREVERRMSKDEGCMHSTFDPRPSTSVQGELF